MPLATISGLRVVKASELGCVLDCDLNTGQKIGGGTATDNTAILSTFLQSATAANPVHLIMDGPTLCTGIVTALSNVSIEGLGWDTGFFVKSGSNACGITNGVPLGDFPGTPPAQSPNYAIKNLRVNGNRATSGTGNSSGSDSRGASGWLNGIDLWNVAGVCIEDVWVHDAPTYAVRLSNCSDVTANRVKITAPSNAVNTDGIHLNGACSAVSIDRGHFNTGDDAIALNAPEGHGGNIFGVTVSNCYFDNACSGLRAYVDTSAYYVDKVAMSNCVGNFVQNTSNYLSAALILGLNTTTSGKTTNGVRSVQVSNCTFSVTNGVIAYLGDWVGRLSFSNVVWEAPTVANPWLQVVGTGGINDLSFTSCSINRTVAGNAKAFGINSIISSGFDIARIRIDGFDIQDQWGFNYGQVPYFFDFTNFTVYALEIDGIDPLNIATLMNPSVGWLANSLVRGAAVLASAFEVPDALMANGSPYLSATSHLPSIKIGGTVKTFTVS